MPLPLNLRAPRFEGASRIADQPQNRLPAPLNPYTGLAGVTAAAALVRMQRPAPTDHAVARDPNPPARKEAPARGLQALLKPAEKMEIHVIDDKALDRRKEGRFSTWMEAQFNPSELEKTLSPVWNDIVVKGYERRHFSHVKSIPFKFVLFFDAYEHMETLQNGQDGQSIVAAGAAFIDSAEKFLNSIALSDEQTGSPPHCLFYWPNFISLTSTIDEIGFKYADFAQSGHLMRFSATVTLREIRYHSLARSTVLADGNRRSSPPTGGVG